MSELSKEYDARVDGAGRSMVAATLVTVMAVMPVFLFGAFVVLIREDIAVSDAELGLIVAAFFLASSSSAIPGGRFADRVGAAGGMTLGSVTSLLSLVGVGLLATAWWHLAAFMILGGVGSGIGMSASNLLLARSVPRAKRGIAFGIKQASTPVASSVAGVSVPLVGLTIGWRWALIGLPIVMLVLYLVLRPATTVDAEEASAATGSRAPLLPMILLAAAAGFAAAAATVTIGFFVESAVERGFSASAAGYALGIGSLAGVVARVAWGWLADRRGRGHLAFLSWLFLTGSVGFGLLGVVTTVPQLVAASVVVFAAGWSWSGLVFLVATLGSPGAPATATGITSAGGGAGGLLGPIVFGALVESGSYTVAWLVTASWMVIAAVLARVTLAVWLRMLAARAAA